MPLGELDAFLGGDANVTWHRVALDLDVLSHQATSYMRADGEMDDRPGLIQATKLRLADTGGHGVIERLPDGWRRALGSRIKASDLAVIDRFVAEARQNHDVYPMDELVFAAFDLTSFESVRAIVLGQDPYYQPGLACGLAFSVPAHLPRHQKRPLALRRILAESRREQDDKIPEDATLEPWARKGVLLLNTVLTVRQGKAGSHAGHGWELLTSAVLARIHRAPDLIHDPGRTNRCPSERE